MSAQYDFLVETYATERLKTLSVWSEFGDPDLGFRPAPMARTPLEHMVHQCMSEDRWFAGMLQIETSMPALPPVEERLAFIRHYAAVSGERLSHLRSREAAWWEQPVAFFETRRQRAWIVLRRLMHSAHHRAQLTVYLRLLGKPLYSTYGPTADTGGLFTHQAPTIYRYESIEALIDAESGGGRWPPLPGAGSQPATERP